MTDVEESWDDRPRRPPTVYALRLARKWVWDDVHSVFIRTVTDVEETHPFLRLHLELAHAFVFVLSRLPQPERRPFADTFYTRRNGPWRWPPPPPTAAAAAVARLVLPLTGRPDLEDVRIADLLTAIAQGDDLAPTPTATREALLKAVARARADLAIENQLEAHAAATIAVVETLDPPGDEAAFQEVLMRATWATLLELGPSGAMDLLLAIDELGGEGRAV